MEFQKKIAASSCPSIIVLALALLVSGCYTKSTTTFVKASWPTITAKDIAYLKSAEPTCLSREKLKQLIEKDTAFAPLKAFYVPASLSDIIAKSLTLNNIGLCDDVSKVDYKYNLDCNGTIDDVPKKFPQFSELKARLCDDNEGLFSGATNSKTHDDLKKSLCSRSQPCFSEQPSSACIMPAVNECGRHISVSLTDPASLALSTRYLPPDQEPGLVVANFKERAQAAIIDYAKAYVERTKAAENKEPGKAVEDLLKTLNPPAVPFISATQKVELTVSSALNSASVDDRFDYLAAYLAVPAVPRSVNGAVSLERVLLLELQAANFARPNSIREAFIDNDIQKAVDSLKVRVENIDNIVTDTRSLDLGTFTSSRSLEATAGQEPDSKLRLTGIEANLSTSRVENIKKELDRRSFWISSDRNLVRITQRGMNETTISGSITAAITLKVPKLSLFTLDISKAAPTSKEKDCSDVCDKAYESTPGKPGKEYAKEQCLAKCPQHGLKLSLSNIDQHLYKSIDAIGVPLGVVRITLPGNYYTQKEPDGIGFAVAEKPALVNLWSHSRQLISIDLRDLEPILPRISKLEPRDKFRKLGVYSVLPDVKQHAVVRDEYVLHNFLEALQCRRLCLQKINSEGNIWYRISPECKNAEVNQGVPGAQEIWVGIEDEEGIVQPFRSMNNGNKEENQAYKDFIAMLPNEINGAKTKCDFVKLPNE